MPTLNSEEPNFLGLALTALIFVEFLSGIAFLMEIEAQPPPKDDLYASWFASSFGMPDSIYSVTPIGKHMTTWGRVKQNHK